MTTTPNSLQAFFAELKRRRVFRVMAMYGVVAFVVLQVADLVFPILELPDWTLQFVLMLALLGFPIAIVIAWAFEATDEGIKRTAPAAPDEIEQIMAQPASKRWPAGLLALLGMVLLFGGGWWMGNRGAGGDGANILVSDAQASDFKTIAALPFENVNGDDENRLIAVGVHDDLLTGMQRIASLRPTARTSVREYEGTDKSFDQIAAELGVEYLLDGSVRSSGGLVVVSVVLVEAATGKPLWTERYEEAFTPENLIAMQARIAGQVVNELEAELTPADLEALNTMARATDADLAALTWYQQAVTVYEESSFNYRQATDFLRRAVEIDPDFVAAWSRLAQMESRAADIEGLDDSAARAARDRTVELAPGSVEAHLATGYVAYYANDDYATALAAFRDAERLAPSDPDVAWAVALILRRQGDWEGSSMMMKKAIALDPRNSLKLSGLYENLAYRGAFEDADAVAERALSLAPSSSTARSNKVISLVNLDRDTRRAHGLATELGLGDGGPEEAATLTSLAYLDRDFDSMAELVADRSAPENEFEVLLDQWLRTWLGIATSDLSFRPVADSLLAFYPEETADMAVIASRLLAALGTQRPATVRREVERAEPVVRRWADATAGGFAGIFLVQAYGFLGDLDTGFDWLEFIIERPGDNQSTAMLRLSPALDAFRNDPRFEEIVRQREAFEAEGAAWAAARRPWLP